MEIEEWNRNMFQISQDIINYLSNFDDCLNYNQYVLVLDIDETVLDLDGKPIKYIVDVYKKAIYNNINVVFITYRIGVQNVIDHTIKQLTENGMGDYLRIYFKPANKNNPFEYKTASRKSLVDEGYIVLMSIGDEPWDIGEYGGIGVRLPKKLKYN